MARTYKRDSNGRFSSTGGARSGRPAARPVSRGKNRITRDNAGRITSVGGEGATARGGRLRTAAGNKRAAQTARIKGGGGKLRKPVASKAGLMSGKMSIKNDEPVVVQRARAGKGYKIPRPPAAAMSKPPIPGRPKSTAKAKPDIGSRMEKAITGIADRRLSKSTSPEKQFKALQTQKRAAEYLRAASKFAQRKNIPLGQALRSGPKNSTKRKKARR